MKLSTREQNGITVFEPSGKIMGGPDATLLNDKLHDCIDSDSMKIVIDLSSVDWMNSTGLGILISSYTTLKNNGGELKLANVTDKIKSLLTITKLGAVFDAHDSVDEAIRSFD